jgi:hypothetical protein
VFRNDYLMRHIEQLAAALARIIGLNRRDEFTAARDEAQRAWEELLDVPRELRDAVDIPTLAGMLREPGRLRLGGRLFAEEARALAGLGDDARAQALRRRALELLLEARALDPNGESEDDAGAISALAVTVPVGRLAARHQALI